MVSLILRNYLSLVLVKPVLICNESNGLTLFYDFTALKTIVFTKTTFTVKSCINSLTSDCINVYASSLYQLNLMNGSTLFCVRSAVYKWHLYAEDSVIQDARLAVKLLFIIKLGGKKINLPI